MAILQAYMAVNLVTPTIFYGSVVSYDATHITLSDGVRTGIYYGSFVYSAFGLAGGVITGYDLYLSGALVGTVREGSTDVLMFNGYMSTGNAQAAYAYAFRLSDKMIGSGSADQLRGFGGADTVSGAAGSDVIRGDGGNDYLNGGAGADVLQGDAGSDVMVWHSLDTFNGGGGTDTLLVTGMGQTLNLRTLPNTRIQNVEVIDISGTGVNRLKLTLQDVLDLSGTTNVLRVEGSPGDFVHRGAGWTYMGPTNGYYKYVQGGATLLIDDDVLNAVL